MEIRHGEGGDDSKQFVTELTGLYQNYCKQHNFKCEIISTKVGFNILQIHGNRLQHYFKYESGNHVVQRIPTNNKSKRQTSTVTVAVLPCVQTNDVQQDIHQSDFEVITQKGSGPGGQHRNKTETSVRMLHKPTGLTVMINNGRSQYHNKQLAYNILYSKLNQLHLESIQKQTQQNRQSQIGFGNRSNKSRTYDMINNIVTDHSTNKKTHNVKAVFKGNLAFVYGDALLNR